MDKTELIIEGAKTLLDVAQNLHSLADCLKSIGNLVLEGFEEKKQITASEPEKKNPAATLEKVRGILADKSRAGHTTEVRAIITKHGAERLSEIAPEDYEAVIKEAEAL